MSDEKINSWRDIAAIIRRHSKDPEEAARSIMAAFNNTPQQITAETVRRVMDAMGGLIGSGTKPDDWLDYEAIAQRANVEQEK